MDPIYESYKESINEKSINLPNDVYQASLGNDAKKWEKWYVNKGFSVDQKTNRLKDKSGNLWKIDTRTKKLIMT